MPLFRVSKSTRTYPTRTVGAFSLLAVLSITLLAAPAPPAVPTADPHRYLADIKTLTTPEMEGRGDGTKGLTRAANLIEKRFKSLGLEPAGTHSYLQPFTVITGAQLKGNNHFVVQAGEQKKELKIKEDFVPFSFSSAGAAQGPLIFAGYGVTADEFQYDDYAGLDVKDKIVVALRYEPASFAAKTGNHGMTRHSQLITKAINARNHGAKAIVLVNGKLGDGEEDLLTRFGSVSGPENVGIVFVQVKNAVADEWLKAAGKSLLETQDKINNSGKPDSFALPAADSASIKVSIVTTRATVNLSLIHI